MPERIEVTLEVDGQRRSVRAWPMARLLDVLRQDLGATGVKEGCGEGECGSCAVLLDGKLVNSCLVPMAQLAGAEVRTVASLEGDAVGQALQQAFLEKGGAQCGICTPGMLLASLSLLRRTPDPTLEEIQLGLAGNLCRCTGYTKIFDSVREAAARLAGEPAREKVGTTP